MAHLLLTAIFAALAALSLSQVARALRSGAIRTGKETVRRFDRPDLFWEHAGYRTLLAMGSAAIALSLASGNRPNLILFHWIFGGSALVLWWRALRTSRTGVGSVSFSRHDEPREYWLLICLYFLGLVAILYVPIARIFA